EDGIRRATVTGVQTCALPISFDPHKTDPTGAPRPLLKQTETVSKHWAMRRASARGSPCPADACATAALNRRAPSRWRPRPLRFEIGRASCRERLWEEGPAGAS